MVKLLVSCIIRKPNVSLVACTGIEHMFVRTQKRCDADDYLDCVIMLASLFCLLVYFSDAPEEKCHSCQVLEVVYARCMGFCIKNPYS